MEFSADFAIIILAALIHASLQLSVGCLMLLHRRSLAAKLLRKKAPDLTGSFVSGAGLLIFLTVMAAGFLVSILSPKTVPIWFWTTLIGILMGLAIATWMLYYKKTGTTLWIPRSFSDYLAKRIKKTDTNTEAFSLGVISVVGEAPFTFALMLAAAGSIVSLDPDLQLLAVTIYTIIAIAPLMTAGLIMSKYRVSDIQKWRSSNKTFLKITGGISFLVLAITLVVFKLMPIMEI